MESAASKNEAATALLDTSSAEHELAKVSLELSETRKELSEVRRELTATREKLAETPAYRRECVIEERTSRSNEFIRMRNTSSIMQERLETIEYYIAHARPPSGSLELLAEDIRHYLVVSGALDYRPVRRT